MPYNPLIHNRQSIRLPGYDYSSEGYYFLTICTHHHQQIFGKINNCMMNLNQLGQFVHNEWKKSVIIRTEIELGAFIIMPNHMHAIVHITRRGFRPNAPTMDAHTPPITAMNAPTTNANTPSGLQPKTIGSLVAGFKSSVTKQINIIRKSPGEPVWQRNYWDHIIRTDESYDQIEDYIINNPSNWYNDKFFTI